MTLEKEVAVTNAVNYFSGFLCGLPAVAYGELEVGTQNPTTCTPSMYHSFFFFSLHSIHFKSIKYFPLIG